MKIKDYRKKHNYTQKQMAEYLNVSLSTIRSWEQGNRNTPEIYYLYLKSTLGDEYALQTAHNKVRKSKKKKSDSLQKNKKLSD